MQTILSLLGPIISILPLCAVEKTSRLYMSACADSPPPPKKKKGQQHFFSFFAEVEHDDDNDDNGGHDDVMQDCSEIIICFRSGRCQLLAGQSSLGPGAVNLSLHADSLHRGRRRGCNQRPQAVLGGAGMRIIGWGA